VDIFLYIRELLTIHLLLNRYGVKIMSQQFQHDRSSRWGMDVLPGAGRYRLEELLSDDAVHNDPERAFSQAVVQRLYDKAEAARRDGDLEKTELDLRIALRLLDEEGDILTYKADGLHSLGLLATARGNYQEAKNYFQDALHTYQEGGSDERDIPYFNHSLGELLRLQGQLDEAERYFGIALQTIEPLEESAARVVINTSLGVLHYEKRDYNKAIEHLERALQEDQLTATAYDKMIALTYLEIARCRESLPESLPRLHEHMRVAENVLQNSEWGGRLNLLLVDVLLTKDDLNYTQEAFNYATQVEWHCAKRLGLKGLEADALAYKAIAGKRLGIDGVEQMASQSIEFYAREEVVSGLATRLRGEVFGQHH